MDEKRRDKGDGSVYQRKDGSWAAQLRPSTNAKPKYFYGKTENEVKKKLREFKKEIAKNDYVEVKKASVKDYMDIWLYEFQVNELKPKSFDRKECTLQNQVYKHIGDIQIGEVTTNDIQKLINALVSDGLSYSTIKKSYDAINGCFKAGITKGEIKKNPCVGVSLPKNLKKQAGDITFFNNDEIELICKESVSQYSNGKQIYRLGQAIIFLIYTGLRIGELLALKWEDINFNKKIARVTDSIVTIKNRDAENSPKYILHHQDSVKTASGDRVVYLNKKALSALEALQKINGKQEYIMSSASGTIMIPRNIDRMLRNILTKCNIKPCGVHALRHTYASMLFKKGVDVKTVSELLGHADVSITYNTYIHLIKEQKQQAVTLLDEL